MLVWSPQSVSDAKTKRDKLVRPSKKRQLLNFCFFKTVRSRIWIDNVDALPTRERQPLFPTPDILKNVFSAFSLVERCGTVSSKG